MLLEDQYKKQDFAKGKTGKKVLEEIHPSLPEKLKPLREWQHMRLYWKDGWWLPMG